MLSTSSPKVPRYATGGKPLNGLRKIHVQEPENSNAAMDALLTETEVSHVLRVSLATLRKWRVDKRGPRFLKIGPLVRYQLEDLREWLSSLPTGGISSARAHGAAGA
jgi:predicted DNA-binding transcriptional regulator AlpA